jgi:hypothetical protein
MNLALAKLGGGTWAAGETLPQLRNARGVQGMVFVLIVHLFPIEGVAPPLFRVTTLAIVASENGIVRVHIGNGVVARQKD